MNDSSSIYIDYENPMNTGNISPQCIKFSINGKPQELKFTLSVALEVEEKFGDIFQFMNNKGSIKNSLFALKLMINQKIKQYNHNYNQNIDEVTEESILNFLDEHFTDFFDSNMFTQVIWSIILNELPNDGVKKN